MNSLKPVLFTAALVFASVQPSLANLVTSLPQGTVVPIPGIDDFGGFPESVTGNISWQSSNNFTQGGSVFGYTHTYGFNGNGMWTGALGPLVGLNDSTANFTGPADTMEFDFSSPVRAVGGFINYVPNPNSPTTIAVWDGTTEIESYNLTFTTNNGTNAGMFLGFAETSNEITSFTLTDNYIALTRLTVVPETTNLSIVALAVAALVAFGWSSKRTTVRA